jgi:hypothetical protein
MNRPGMPKTENWPWGETRSDPNLLIENAATESQAGPLPGWYAVSVNQNHRVAGDLEYLLEFEPVDWIGYSMMVFHITLEEANRVRKKLGMEEIP